MSKAAIGLCCGAAFLGLTGQDGALAQGKPVAPAASSFPSIGHTDPRYESYNLDLIAITGMAAKPKMELARATPQGENDAKVATVMSGVQLERPLDLGNARLRKLAAGLAPAYLRTSGTSANSVYFQDDDKPLLTQPPAGFATVMNRAQWKGVLDFARAVDAKLLVSFAINDAVRDASGTWTPRMAKPWADYTRRIGGSFYAAELFNEPNLPSYGGAPKGYNPAWFARDQMAFRAFTAKALPTMKIVGPGDVVTANYPLPGNVPGDSLMNVEHRPRFDIISYHFYPAVALRCAPARSPVGTTPDDALTEAWLAKTDKSIEDHKALRDRYEPGAPIWNTETAGAACSGAAWDATFIDSFRYVDQLGRLARQGASAVFHQTLVGGNYGLLDPVTFQPRPNYWAALLWKRFMGSTVLDAGNGADGLHLYAHCTPHKRGAVTMLAINLNSASRSIELQTGGQLYALTSSELQSATVDLNGRELALGKSDALPRLDPLTVKSGSVTLAPHSINFVVMAAAQNGACT